MNKENQIGIHESSILIPRITTTNQIMINKISFRSPPKPRGRKDYGEKKNSKLERWAGVGCRNDPLRQIIGKAGLYCNECRTRTKRDEKNVVDTKTDHGCPYTMHVGEVSVSGERARGVGA